MQADKGREEEAREIESFLCPNPTATSSKVLPSLSGSLSLPLWLSLSLSLGVVCRQSPLNGG